MKSTMRNLFGLSHIFLWHYAVVGATAVRFGPNNCVALSHSTRGTCVLSTNCREADIAQFEFAFTCTTPRREVQKHSFGVGGFDAVEAFDTEVQCTKCDPPPPTSGAKHLLKKKEAVKIGIKPAKTNYVVNTTAEGGATEETKQDEEGEESLAHAVIKDTLVKTGPNDCVEIYRANKTSTCVIHTNCENQVINNYEFGLDCVDKDNNQVRHLFGKDSFLPQEWFDTLIICNQCLAILNQSSEAVAEIESRVENIEQEMVSLKKSMETLGTKVDSYANTTFMLMHKPADVVQMTKTSGEVKQETKHHKKVKHNLRHRKHKHVKHDDADEEEDDDDLDHEDKHEHDQEDKDHEETDKHDHDDDEDDY